MSKKKDYQDLDDWEDSDVEDDEPGNDIPLDKTRGTKDARRRLDDLLEERRLKAQMIDDF